MDKQFILGVDLDGVCGDYLGPMKKFIAEDRGVHPDTLTDEVSWNCPEWELSREEFKSYHDRALKEARMFLNMPVMPGASEALWELSDAGIWIRVITHRLFMSGSHAIAASDTVQWLDNVNIPYRDICFIGGKQDVGANLYIDDSPNVVHSLQENDLPVIIFDHSSNKHFDRTKSYELGRSQGHGIRII